MLPKMCLETVARLIADNPAEYDYRLAEAIVYKYCRYCPKTKPLGDINAYLAYCNYYPEDYVLACWLYLQKDEKGKNIEEVDFEKLTRRIRKLLNVAKRLSKGYHKLVD